MDIPWAIAELDQFVDLTALRPTRSVADGIYTTSRGNKGDAAEIVASAQVIEQILDRVVPTWRSSVSDDKNQIVNRWLQHREAAMRARTELERREEVQDKLGDNAPQLNAARLHPWIWDGARSLWQSGHYREAVQAAAIKLNAELQNKLGRRDKSETALFQMAFSADPPKPDSPRLRVMTDDGSQTFKSLHRGVMALAEGCYAALRNPISHESGELSADRGLEQLACFSVLARWVDEASLLTA